MNIRTLSLHIDEQTYKQIEEKADAQGSDAEQVIVQMVQQAMGQLMTTQEGQPATGVSAFGSKERKTASTGAQQSPDDQRSSAGSPVDGIAGAQAAPQPSTAHLHDTLALVEARGEFLSEESAQAVAQAQAQAESIIAQAHAQD